MDRDDRPYECCRRPENFGPPEPTDNPRMTFERCRVCGRRHFLADLDPVRIDIIGRPAGDILPPRVVTEFTY